MDHESSYKARAGLIEEGNLSESKDFSGQKAGVEVYSRKEFFHKHRKDMKSEDKKDEILRVAEEIFAEKGFKGTTMQDIAERIGIQKPGLYYHFVNKQGIYSSLIKDVYHQLQVSVREPFFQGQGLEEKIRLLIVNLVDFWADHPRFPRLITHEILSDGDMIYSELIPNIWMPMFQEVVQELGKKGSKESQDKEVDVGLLVINIFAMTVFYFFVGSILNSLTGENYSAPEKVQKLKNEVVNLVFNGIKGRL